MGHLLRQNTRKKVELGVEVHHSREVATGKKRDGTIMTESRRVQ